MPFPEKKECDCGVTLKESGLCTCGFAGFNEAIDLCTKAVSVEMIAKLIASQDYRNKSKFKWEELSKKDKNDYYNDAQAIHSAIIRGE